MYGILQKSLFFLYHSFWTLAAALLLPFSMILRRRGLAERLGLRPLPNPPENRPLWVHALSVGEVISALPLLKALRQSHPGRPVVFTATTLQGLEIARREVGAEGVQILRMPMDFWWAMRRMVRQLNPMLLVIVETDLWPGLLHLMRGRGTKSLLVNGRISPRTFRSYRRFRLPVRSMLFADLDLCLMQSDLDRERLLHIGIPPHRVVTAGNIKFDRPWVPMDRGEYLHWVKVLALTPEDIVWVAGSTHKGEEEIVLGVFSRLRALFPRLRLIIAPRRIEEAEDVSETARRKGLRTFLRRHLALGGEPCDIIVLDTLGELGRIYGLAEISFVGGSLVPHGGHNLLEPACFGRPVLFGPYTHNFVLMSELLLEAGGGKRVKDGEDLFQVMKDLLSSPEEAERMGERAREFVQQSRGALKRVLKHIKVYL
ncbi:MAG: 3-deoxy-D-manno-octulosonic acid transferase [Deltaproteobacteria bacterium]|nr:3-deoxy-D-manno-octulosonic acid transferase [Deltaproteobacteria bacterium]